MGSIVTLGLGRLEVDWGKNESFNNHSRLFLPSDVKLISHHYADEESPVIEIERAGLARPLRSVLRRLELLGYTLDEARRHFEQGIEPLFDGVERPDVAFEEFLGSSLQSTFRR